MKQLVCEYLLSEMSLPQSVISACLRRGGAYSAKGVNSDSFSMRANDLQFRMKKPPTPAS